MRFFVGLLADADGIAGITRGAVIDRRTPAFGVMRHMRLHVDLAGRGDEVLRIKSFVAGKRDRLRSVGMASGRGSPARHYGLCRAAGQSRLSPGSSCFRTRNARQKAKTLPLAASAPRSGTSRPRRLPADSRRSW